jgi:hypothetical protein
MRSPATYRADTTSNSSQWADDWGALHARLGGKGAAGPGLVRSDEEPWENKWVAGLPSSSVRTLPFRQPYWQPRCNLG